MLVRLPILVLLGFALASGAAKAYAQCGDNPDASQYSLDDVTFERATAFPVSQLRALIPVASGEAFETAKIRSGLEALRDFYGEHGYVNFTAIPETECDEGRKTVQLTMVLDEGGQFRVAKVLILAPKDVAERLYSAWPVKPGAIYDTKRVHQFFLDNRTLLPAGWVPAENLDISLDEQSKSIKVRLNVCPAGQFCPQTSRGF